MIHVVYDVTGCATPNPEPAELIEAMRDTVHRLGCSVLGELPVLFQPHGTTCVLVLAESHLTVSTWPEHELAHVDLFTCRADIDPDQAIAPILTTLGAGTVHGQRVHRTDPLQLRGQVGRHRAVIQQCTIPRKPERRAHDGVRGALGLEPTVFSRSITESW